MFKPRFKPREPARRHYGISEVSGIHFQDEILHFSENNRILVLDDPPYYTLRQMFLDLGANWRRGRLAAR